MSRDCADLNYCLMCGYPTGLENINCKCYCHTLIEWTDNANILHTIDKKGNEKITRIDENGKEIITTISKRQLKEMGNIHYF